MLCPVQLNFLVISGQWKVKYEGLCSIKFGKNLASSQDLNPRPHVTHDKNRRDTDTSECDSPL